VPKHRKSPKSANEKKSAKKGKCQKKKNVPEERKNANRTQLVLLGIYFILPVLHWPNPRPHFPPVSAVPFLTTAAVLWMFGGPHCPGAMYWVGQLMHLWICCGPDGW
jgi:hypothetical protein